MEKAVVQQIRKNNAHSKIGETFFVSSFHQYDVEYATKLLAMTCDNLFVANTQRKRNINVQIADDL